jgi:hypothetical protein
MKAVLSHSVGVVVIPEMKLKPEVAAQKHRLTKDKIVSNCPRQNDGET